jgi:tetratricopeptide (TPR) repeat protein
MPAGRRPSLAPAGFAFVLALGVRGAGLLALHGTPFTRVMVGDSFSYLELADLIGEGRLSEVGVFFQNPLYPIFLAALHAAVGRGWLAVAAVQTVLGSLGCAAVAALAGRCFPHRAGAPWLAGAAAALYGPMAFHDLEVLPTSPAVALLSGGLLLAATARGPGGALAAGLLLGAASGFAPSLLCAVIAAAAVLALPEAGGRPRPAPAAALLLGAALAVAPIALHNLRSGDRVLLASNAGVNLFVGNHPSATGSFVLPPGSGLDGTRLEASAREEAERAAGRPLRPSEVSAHWAGRALAWAASDPAGWLRLLGRKIALTVNHHEIPNHLNLRFVVDRFAAPLRFTLPFWAVWALAGPGFLAAARARGEARRPAQLVLAAAAATLAVPVVFFVTGRYRVPAAPPLLVLAAGGVTSLAAIAGRRSWGRLLAGVALVAGMGLATRASLVREGDYSFDHVLLGAAYRTLGDLDAAVIEFKLAEETGPARLDAAWRLAQVLEARGNRRVAAAALRRHLARHPGDAGAQAALEALARLGDDPSAPPIPSTDFEAGLDRAGRGEWAAAAALLERAVDRDPEHAAALSALGIVRERQGDLDAAVRLLERAASLQAGNPAIWKNLAAAYAKAGRPADARRAAAAALELAPDDPDARALATRLGATR